MRRPKSKANLSQLPTLGALVLGFGALIGGDAQAGHPGAEVRAPAASAGQDEVLIRTEGEAIYLSQGGRPFQELSLGDTPEGAHLKELLRSMGAAGGAIRAPIGSFIVANGGSGLPGNKPVAKEQRAKKAATKKTRQSRTNGSGAR